MIDLGSSLIRFRGPRGLVRIGLTALLLLLTSGTHPSLHAEPAVLRVAFTADPITLDPHKSTTTWEFLTQPLLHLTLVDIRETTRLIPRAASSWTSSPDHRRFTFQLRRNLSFSNGRPVVADDFVYGLERILNPATGTFFQSSLLGVRGAKAFIEGKTTHVEGLQAPSPDVLVIELERGEPSFGFGLAQIAYPLPREAVESNATNFGQHPVGAGPYRVARWERGTRLVLERRPEYRGPEPALFDVVDIFIGSDTTTHLMMFERGELDLANVVSQSLPFPSFRRLSSNPRWKDLIESQLGLSTDYIALNVEIPPFNNVLVRRAVNHAIDRDRRMQVAQGYESHAEGIIPKSIPEHDPNLRGYAYDPVKARSLLAQSGVALPVRTQLWHDATELDRIRAQGFQWDLHMVGIEVDLKEVSSAQLSQAAGTRGKVPMSIHTWSAGLPDPWEFFNYLLHSQAISQEPTFNQSFYRNPKVNRLIDLASAEVDPFIRCRYYREAEVLVVEDAPWVFLGHSNFLSLRQPWIHGPLIEPAWYYRLDRIRSIR